MDINRSNAEQAELLEAVEEDVGRYEGEVHGEEETEADEDLEEKIIRTGTGIEIKRRKKRKMRTTMRRRRTAMMRSKKMRMITMIRMARIGMRSKKMKMSQQLEPSVG